MPYSRRSQFLFGFAASAVALLHPSVASAAERIVLRYSILEETISVADLTTLAQTGKASPDLETYLRLANKEPQQLQQALTKTVDIDPVVLDKVLNSPVGDVMLDEIGKTIHTPQDAANRQALRAALVLSASNDKKISLLETIQNYPTQEVNVEGEKLVGAYRQLSEVAKQVRKVLGFLSVF